MGRHHVSRMRYLTLLGSEALLCSPEAPLPLHCPLALGSQGGHPAPTLEGRAGFLCFDFVFSFGSLGARDAGGTALRLHVWPQMSVLRHTVALGRPMN